MTMLLMLLIALNRKSRGIVASVKPFGIFVDIFEVPQLHCWCNPACALQNRWLYDAVNL